jgi:hypothetical protein
MKGEQLPLPWGNEAWSKERIKRFLANAKKGVFNNGTEQQQGDAELHEARERLQPEGLEAGESDCRD